MRWSCRRERCAPGRQLWDVEDRLRLKEASQSFDEEFVKLARSVYQLNDQRAALKRQVNLLTHSALVEEKGYAGLATPG